MIVAGKKLEDMPLKLRVQHCAGNGYNYVVTADGYQLTRINKWKETGEYQVRVYNNTDPKDEEKPLTIRSVRF